MNNSTNLPILVTLRSAEALRDAGIRYAYLKAGMLASMAGAVFFMTCALWLLSRGLGHPHPLVWLLLVFAVASCLAMFVCGRAVEFPHCPRLTLDELEIMKNGMGLSPQVFQQTNDSVLHGSMDEVHALWKAQSLIQRLMKS